MNTFIKHLFHILIPCLLLALFSACNAEDGPDNTYQGVNKIILQPEVSNQLLENGTDELTVNIYLVKAVDYDITLDFALHNHLVAGQPIATLEKQQVQLLKGEKKAQLKIKSSSIFQLSESKEIALVLTKNSSELAAETNLPIYITPLSQLPELTEEQITLLNHYKSQGLDLFPLMGYLSVEGSVYRPAGHHIEALNVENTAIIKGKTAITLSEKSTLEQPVLKMVINPLGLDTYLYTLFRNLTIDDYDFWNNQGEFASPINRAIMKMVDLTPTSLETFTTTLDDIYIDLKTKEITFLAAHEDFYGDEFYAMPFAFQYSAWTRYKKLMDEGDPIALENYEMGGRLDPGYYLNTATIEENELDHISWKESKVYFKDNQLIFDFIMYYADADGYLNVNAVYNF